LNLSAAEFQRIQTLKDKIASLEKELIAILSKFGAAAKSVTAADEAPVTKGRRGRKKKVESILDAAEPVRRGRKKRNMSAAGRARIAAAQKARWAKSSAAVDSLKLEVKTAKAAKAAKAAKPAKVKKDKKVRNISPEARERIAAAQRRRWAASKTPEAKS